MPPRPVALYEDDDYKVFPAIWPKSALKRLSYLAQAGSFGIKRALDHLKTKKIPAKAWGKLCDINGNSKEDIQKALGENPLCDPYGRRMHYLRFSLTEACNLSCTYCLPKGYPEWYRHKARLGFEDIKTILEGFRLLGFRKVRFTGGEPTLHPKCLNAISVARDLGFEHIALTTNGLLIDDLTAYKEAGLTQINFSLDTLRQKTFHEMTGSPHLERLLETIDKALDLSMATKINTVLLKSQNGGEIEELIQYALSKPLTLRFIELMPTGLNRSFYEKEQVKGPVIEKILRQMGLSPKAKAKGIDLSGPEVVWKGEGVGKIGLINPLSCNFCDACNRLRVSAKGALRLCLFGDNDPMLDLENKESVAKKVRQLVLGKKERHHLEELNLGNVKTFRNIGG